MLVSEKTGFTNKSKRTDIMTSEEVKSVAIIILSVVNVMLVGFGMYLLATSRRDSRHFDHGVLCILLGAGINILTWIIALTD